jgi:hypothetical protein
LLLRGLLVFLSLRSAVAVQVEGRPTLLNGLVAAAAAAV